jgi:hypothetical protein
VCVCAGVTVCTQVFMMYVMLSTLVCKRTGHVDILTQVLVPKSDFFLNNGIIKGKCCHI